jgi:hypothetical protein
LPHSWKRRLVSQPFEPVFDSWFTNLAFSQVGQVVPLRHVRPDAEVGGGTR